MKASELLAKIQAIYDRNGDFDIGFKFFFKPYDIALEKAYGNSEYPYYIKATVGRGDNKVGWDEPRIRFTHKYRIGDEFVVIIDGSAQIHKVTCINYDTAMAIVRYRGHCTDYFNESEMTPTTNTHLGCYKVDVVPYFKVGDRVNLELPYGMGVVESFDYDNLNGVEMVCCKVRTNAGKLVTANEKGIVLDKNGYEKE